MQPNMALLILLALWAGFAWSATIPVRRASARAAARIAARASRE